MVKTINGRRTVYVWDGTNLRYETRENGTHTYAYATTGVYMMDGNTTSSRHTITVRAA